MLIVPFKLCKISIHKNLHSFSNIFLISKLDKKQHILIIKRHLHLQSSIEVQSIN